MFDLSNWETGVTIYGNGEAVCDVSLTIIVGGVILDSRYAKP